MLGMESLIIFRVELGLFRLESLEIKVEKRGAGNSVKIHSVSEYNMLGNMYISQSSLTRVQSQMAYCPDDSIRA